MQPNIFPLLFFFIIQKVMLSWQTVLSVVSV